MQSQDSLSSNNNMHLPATRCPNCWMIWIAPGLAQGDTYECKHCRLTFVVCDPSAETLQPSAAVRREDDSPHKE
jgi:hypothetical protein